MEFQRSSGVLLHVSSLPSYGGIGDLGPAAHEFVAFLAAAKQHVWQVLPLCPTGYGNSPYAGSSAFAGNPYSHQPRSFSPTGDGSTASASPASPGRGGNVDFDEVEQRKLPLLYEAAGNFLDRGPHEPKLAEQWKQFQEFCRAEVSWLTDYALYAELRRQFKTGAWTAWPEPLRRREPQALAEVAASMRRARWPRSRCCSLPSRCSGISSARPPRATRSASLATWPSSSTWIRPTSGFIPSSSNWTRSSSRSASPASRPITSPPPASAGAIRSIAGMCWPSSGFAWWIERIRRACQLYDIVRLDHFRGFEAYWAIPAEEETAINGEWIKAPGLELFRALEAALGPLPLVAEDLGLITPEVEALRLELGLPGMKVLQFGFSNKGAHIHLPHRFTPATVAYTGTHDNDTTQGWWKTAEQDGAAKPSKRCVGPVRRASPVWPLIRAAAASVAEMAVVPAQDLLELGSEARMNTPAVPAGNWSWRAPEACWTPELAARLAALAEVTDRDNDPLGEAGRRICERRIDLSSSIRLQQAQNQPAKVSTRNGYAKYGSGEVVGSTCWPTEYFPATMANRTAAHDACGARPQGELFGNAGEQQRGRPQRRARGKRWNARFQRPGRSAQHHALANGVDKEPGRNTVVAFSEVPDRKQASGHHQCGAIDAPCKSREHSVA